MRSAQLQRLFGSDDWSVRSLKAEGDCFYLGIQILSMNIRFLSSFAASSCSFFR
jgi:hypothetical protein